MNFTITLNRRLSEDKSKRNWHVTTSEVTTWLKFGWNLKFVWDVKSSTVSHMDQLARAPTKLVIKKYKILDKVQKPITFLQNTWYGKGTPQKKTHHLFLDFWRCTLHQHGDSERGWGEASWKRDSCQIQYHHHQWWWWWWWWFIICITLEEFWTGRSGRLGCWRGDWQGRGWWGGAGPSGGRRRWSSGLPPGPQPYSWWCPAGWCKGGDGEG